MTGEQLRFRSLILADLRVVETFVNSANKADRLQAAYHAQQAIEKTIKLKAWIKGLPWWNVHAWRVHDIKKLINLCENSNLEINIPSVIKKNANMYFTWEAEARYNPCLLARKDSILLAYKTVKKWLDEGDTFV